ncbi:RBBP9/YdeN family alpha/beta hydrolase [Actinomadura parmotrematis]|uniref:Alpha/beta hydrolase n=1 Tax=Actinomadura parmotrematis TaxID=2864039 RepID=A0ABS7FWG4_9ACTN|nr:alpha/beta hydrolase [Actinomadura parmotrematis]MBW8483788.1 alpha/beta hydrolase [Actinomadura parmotrematis]
MADGTPSRQATIIHGYGATPGDHWFGWLAARLGEAGVRTAVPALPDPLAPDPARWAKAVDAAVGVPGEGAIVVAHSLGCLAVLRHLRSLREPWRLDALVLVAGFTDRLPALPELDSFIGDGCDVTDLADRVDRLAVLRSDADAAVPTALTDRLAERLGVAARIVPGAGHFLADEGVTQLPEALAAALG